MGPSPNCNPIQIASARAELNGTVDTAIQALAAKATFSISLFTRVPFLAPTFPELSEVEWCGYEWCGSDGLLTPGVAPRCRVSLRQDRNVRLYSFFFTKITPDDQGSSTNIIQSES